MKYYPRVTPHRDYFTYEYWWVTTKDIHGPRLVKVRVPPKTGPCNKKSFWEFYTLGLEDPNMYGWKDKDKFIWVDYIHEPDTSMFDCRVK